MGRNFTFVSVVLVFLLGAYILLHSNIENSPEDSISANEIMATTTSSPEPETNVTSGQDQQKSPPKLSKTNSQRQVAVNSNEQPQAFTRRAFPVNPRLDLSPSRKPAAGTLRVSEALGGRWKVWTGVKAMPASEGAKQDLTNMVITESSGYAPDLRHFKRGESVVVFDERTQVAGLVSGAFNVEIKKDGDLEVLKQRYGLDVTSSFPEINRYFLVPRAEVFNLEDLQRSLEKDPMVSESLIEINRGVYVKF